MNEPQATITVKVDLTNPGQFFACCGLLELADRLWPGAEGWFGEGEFKIRRAGDVKLDDASTLLKAIGDCALTSTMTDEQTERLKKLKNLNKKLRTAETDAEAARLDELWERERLHLGPPFNLWLDWWSDDVAGGKSLKTWAGKQLISDIVRKLRAPLQQESWRTLPPQHWLTEGISAGCMPLYFDSNIGGHSSSIDVGYSLDALDMPSQVRPLIEFLAFVGLQRFRPKPIIDKELYHFVIWGRPMPPLLAAAGCNDALPLADSRRFEFRLLYRTKYLKSLLPAVPLSARGDA